MEVDSFALMDTWQTYVLLTVKYTQHLSDRHLEFILYSGLWQKCTLVRSFSIVIEVIG